MSEKAGKADLVTEYDEEFESLCVQMDQIKLMTEKMLTHVITMMQPNPSMCVCACVFVERGGGDTNEFSQALPWEWEWKEVGWA